MKRLGRWLRGSLWLLFALFVGWQAWIFGQIWWWRDHPPESSSFMRLRLAELRLKNPQASLAHHWVPYGRISDHLKRAVVSAEDERFVTHDGFDWQGIQNALEKNQRRGRALAGGSTISQQLAKNLFLSPSRSYVRKGEEALITLMIESLWSKERILEVYLNVAEWGEGIFGIGAASWHYFDIEADRLGPAESAKLAVMLPNPRQYGRHFGPEQTARATRLLTYMSKTKIP
ncbi:MAG: monofunctional biosynthetic peptidoglycan transglycosylase [Azoarcus sp.]|nr:monofunctional biosynthetic peptidoglycan transglycosylase [Azoarcus sp.]